MTGELVLSELGITLVAKDHNPTILNPDFLRYNGIVPREWELEGDPVCAGPVARVAFANGVQIMAEPQKISFFEPFANGKEWVKAQLPRIAEQYAVTLPHVNYHAIGVNPKAHLLCDSTKDAEDFIRGRLIAEGPWKKLDGVEAAIVTNFTYMMPDGRYTLTVAPASRRQKETGAVSVLLFSGNAHFQVSGANKDETAASIKRILGGWTLAVETYLRLVTVNFLGQEAST